MKAKNKLTPFQAFANDFREHISNNKELQTKLKRKILILPSKVQTLTRKCTFRKPGLR